MSCCNLLAPVYQLSSNSWSSRMSFFTSASVHCQTLPGISFLLNLPEWVWGYISRFPCAKQISSVSSGEPFLWQKACRTDFYSSRPLVLSDNCLDDIHQTLLRYPWKSLRKLSLQSGLSYGSVHKATKISKLHLHLVHVMQSLKEPDKEKQYNYYTWFTKFILGSGST
jgi:hypothetical protein